MQPLAYFMTWTTYGSWLPGDDRGWVDKHEWGIHPSQHGLHQYAKGILKKNIVTFNAEERKCIISAIMDTIDYKEWRIHALHVGTNHIHLVISTNADAPQYVLKTVKNYSTRALRRIERFRQKVKIWTKGGSIRYLNTRNDVKAAIEYVENQCISP